MKASRFKDFSFTMNTLEIPLPDSETMLQRFTELEASGVFQLERGEESGREHYQGLIKFQRKETKTKWLKAICDGIYPIESLTLEPMVNERALTNYCTKSKTRIYGPWYYGAYKVADSYSPDIDIELYPWQNTLWDILKVPHSLKNERTVLVLIDGPGSKGKSKMVKYIMVKDKIRNFMKMPRDSIKSSISSAVSIYKNLGRIQGWFVDIPRKNNESETPLSNTCQIIEELKSGVLIDTMYGRGDTVMMTPPHIVVFCNEYSREDFLKYLSGDRLIFLEVVNNELCAASEQDGKRLQQRFPIARYNSFDEPKFKNSETN